LSRSVAFLPEAEQEVTDAQAWYEDQTRGLWQQFVTCVAAEIEALRDEPDRLPRVDGEHRPAVLRRFPDAVFNLVAPQSVNVIAVFHTSRDAAYW
jgi:plasmid stabilization system protein ParE